MAQAIVAIDLSIYESIKRIMVEIKELKQKWPDDYKSRIGYTTKVNRIMDLLPLALESKWQ